jgi:hypothetical protein
MAQVDPQRLLQRISAEYGRLAIEYLGASEQIKALEEEVAQLKAQLETLKVDKSQPASVDSQKENHSAELSN